MQLETENNTISVKKRFWVLFVFMILWTAVITYHLLFYTVIKQDKYLKLGNKLAMRKWSVPATRGRILDKNKTPLAWTNRIYKLNLIKIPNNKKRKLSLEKKIKHYLGKYDYVLGLGVVKNNILPSEFLGIKEKLINNYQELELKFNFERRYVDYEKIRDMLGAVKLEDDNYIGVSGIELKYNNTLKGIDGVFTVMLNKTGDIISGTLKNKIPIQQGEDVILDSTLDEILK